MRLNKALRVTAAATFALGLAAVAGPGTAHASGDSQQYVAGSSIAKILGYDVATWSKKWGCAYAGWASPSKSWACHLYDGTDSFHLVSHSGTFTGSSKDTPTYYYPTNNQILCTHAEATYQDGSDGDSDRKCG